MLWGKGRGILALKYLWPRTPRKHYGGQGENIDFTPTLRHGTCNRPAMLYFPAMIMHHSKIVTFFLCFLLLVTQCANQLSPSGGPDDTTGPTPLTTSPASEATGVKTNTEISVTFSEWILPTSVKGVSLYPSVPIKTKVKGNRLLVKLLKPLADSTTYHCVITSTLKDLHNNSIRQPLSIIFSTGATLDKGSVSGCVSDPARAHLQPNVALFHYPQQKGDSGFCSTPDYLVQSDSNGVFTFTNLRSGTYNLIAYLDKNSDYRLQQGTEELYLSTDSVVTITESSTPRLTLYPSTFDTTRQTIASLATINNRTISGTWKRPYDSLLQPLPPTFILEPIDKPDIRIGTTFKQLGATTRFLLLPDTTLDSVAYRVITAASSYFDTTHVLDTLRVNGAAIADTTPPSLLKALPTTPCELTPTLSLIWSEPVQTHDTLYLADTLGLDTAIFTGDTAFSDTSLFTTSRSLLPGHTYRTVLSASSGRDLQGNPLKTRDTTDTAAIISITILHVDSFALSITGSAACLDKSPARIWSFQPFSGGKPIIAIDRENAFRFDSIPAAKGRLSTFIDYNGNNRPDPGHLIPFVAPEPFVYFADTIEARARWDVEGIVLTPCDACERKRIDAEKVAALAKADSLAVKK